VTTLSCRPAVERVAKVRITSQSRLQDVASTNAVAVIEGGDALLRHEQVVVTAHPDHLGMAPGLTLVANLNVDMPMLTCD
jgi:hypothetical protein